MNGSIAYLAAVNHLPASVMWVHVAFWSVVIVYSVFLVYLVWLSRNRGTMLVEGNEGEDDDEDAMNSISGGGGNGGSLRRPLLLYSVYSKNTSTQGARVLDEDDVDMVTPRGEYPSSSGVFPRMAGGDGGTGNRLLLSPSQKVQDQNRKQKNSEKVSSHALAGSFV